MSSRTEDISKGHFKKVNNLRATRDREQSVDINDDTHSKCVWENVRFTRHGREVDRNVEQVGLDRSYENGTAINIRYKKQSFRQRRVSPYFVWLFNKTLERWEFESLKNCV